MLYRIIIANYRSFADCTEFNMFHDPERTMLPKHVHRKGITPLVKTCAIYGANGSGKTNLISAFGFLYNFVVSSLWDGDNNDGLKKWYYANRFQLPPQEGKPIEMLIEFEAKREFSPDDKDKKKEGERTVYIYNIEIDDSGVKREKLLVSGLGKKSNRLIFDRAYRKVIFGSNTVSKEAKCFIKKMIMRGSVMSVLGLSSRQWCINDTDIQAAFRWLSVNMEVAYSTVSVPKLADIYDKSKHLATFAGKILKKMDLGINGISIRRKNNTDANNNDKELMLLCQGREGGECTMGIETQSDGILRLLGIIPFFYDAYKKRKTIIVDNIDNSVHSLALRNIIETFWSRKTTGQLIFTVHNTILLDRSIIRPEEVWFVEKEDGRSVMYSLNEFKMSNYIDIQDAYLEGRFGAVPQMANNG